MVNSWIIRGMVIPSLIGFDIYIYTYIYIYIYVYIHICIYIYSFFHWFPSDDGTTTIQIPGRSKMEHCFDGILGLRSCCSLLFIWGRPSWLFLIFTIGVSWRWAICPKVPSHRELIKGIFVCFRAVKAVAEASRNYLFDAPQEEKAAKLQLNCHRSNSLFMCVCACVLFYRQVWTAQMWNAWSSGCNDHINKLVICITCIWVHLRIGYPKFQCFVNIISTETP